MKIVQYNGEFGFELVCVVPYAYWLHKQGEKFRTISSLDTKCLYYFCDNHIEKFTSRLSRDAIGFDNLRPNGPSLNVSRWIPPDYKSHFKNDIFVFDKPILVINNKYNSEWGGKPANFLDIPTLEKTIDLLKDKYTIIYNRIYSKKYINDGGTKAYDLNEFSHLKSKFRKDIIFIQDLQKSHPNLTFNELQLQVMANCDNFISVQGGNSILASYFGGQNLIFCKKGGELDNGSFSFYSLFSQCDVAVSQTYKDFLKQIESSF